MCFYPECFDAVSLTLKLKNILSLSLLPRKRETIMVGEVLQNLSEEAARAQKLFSKGMELLKMGKPREAAKRLMKALELNPDFPEARYALEEALEALNWNSFYFCNECGKLALPKSSYPWLQIDGFCPRCGNSLPTKKEELLAFTELAVKAVLFGIFPVVTFLFCAIPYLQLDPQLKIVKVMWNAFYDGLYMAATFTPIVLIGLYLFGDPEGYTLRNFNYYTFASLPTPIDFVAALLFFLVLVYLYFLLMLTPIISLHKIGMWKSKEHQKTVWTFTLIYWGIIALIRISFGATY